MRSEALSIVLIFKVDSQELMAWHVLRAAVPLLATADSIDICTLEDVLGQSIEHNITCDEQTHAYHRFFQRCVEFWIAKEVLISNHSSVQLAA